MIGRLCTLGCSITCVGIFFLPPAQAQPAASLLDHLQLHVSEALLDEIARQSVDEQLAVHDVILGVPVEGSAQVTGTTHLRVVPDDDRAVFEVVLHGTARSATTGRSPPVSIRSEAVTRFTATKRIYLDDSGLKAQPANCRAETESQVIAVDTDWPGLRGWVVRRVAWRRVQNSHEEADDIASRHAERDLGRSFDRQCAALIEQANTLLASRWLRGADSTTPRRLCCLTTSDHFYARFAPANELDRRAAFDAVTDAPAVLAVPVSAVGVSQTLQLLGAWLSEGFAGLGRELTGEPLSPEAVAWLANSGSLGPRFSPVPSLADGWFRLTLRPAAPPATHVTVAQRAP